MTTENTQVRHPALRRRRAAVALVALAAALIALALPGFAAAEVFTVDTNNDEVQFGPEPCETENGLCSLRAAVETSNTNLSFDVIDLDNPPFDGPGGANSEIQLGSTLEITQAVTIFGHPVTGGPFEVPDVAVSGPLGAATFTVKANGVTIEDIAIGGGKYGIEVPGASTELKAVSDWFGLSLNGSPQPIQKAGILLGPGADGATIGGLQDTERNVFAHAELGISVDGASETAILGNYIGVTPAGSAVAGLDNGVRITDAVGFPAAENVVGGTLSGPQVGTAVCDGPCNVIATEGGEGIDLAGSTAGSAASGPTTIQGNYLGLAASGVAAVGDNADAVRAASPTGTCSAGPADVSVGGPAATERNYVAGGVFGIYAESAQNFNAIGNSIGIGPSGNVIESPLATAIGLCNTGVTEPAFIAGNQMVLGPNTNGIESAFGQAQIFGNSIEGGRTGILTEGAEVGGGNLIADNSITEPGTRGIEIEDDLNVVTGNTIVKAGRAGIEIETDADHNRIGGDGLGEANTIIETVGPEPEDAAITIFGRETGRNEVAANNGFANPGAFIKLLGHGSSEKPNGGIQPPVLATVRQSSAVGTAQPNATVRLFSKASAEPGELGELLAVVRADAAGNWTATYATQAVGGLVAATQTSEAGTAEAGTSAVSAPTAASADPAKPTEPEKPADKTPAGGGSNATPIATPAPKPPAVKITSGPKKSSTATNAKFKFKAEPAAGAKFECKLDGAKWAKCGSPKTYKGIKPGKHTFRVRATAGGLTSTVTKFQFTVVGKK